MADRPSGRQRTKKNEPPAVLAGGRVLAAVDGYLAGLDAADPRVAVLGEGLRAAAAQLDSGAGMATAAVLREIRATVNELEGGRTGGDADPFEEWERSLGSPS